jgi:hypothetical protein
MKDLIVDVLGALFVCIIGYILLKRRRNKENEPSRCKRRGIKPHCE